MLNMKSLVNSIIFNDHYIEAGTISCSLFCIIITVRQYEKLDNNNNGLLKTVK